MDLWARVLSCNYSMGEQNLHLKFTEIDNSFVVRHSNRENKSPAVFVSKEKKNGNRGQNNNSINNHGLHSCWYLFFFRQRHAYWFKNSFERFPGDIIFSGRYFWHMFRGKLLKTSGKNKKQKPKRRWLN